MRSWLWWRSATVPRRWMSATARVRRALRRFRVSQTATSAHRELAGPAHARLGSTSQSGCPASGWLCRSRMGPAVQRLTRPLWPHASQTLLARISHELARTSRSTCGSLCAQCASRSSTRLTSRSLTRIASQSRRSRRRCLSGVRQPRARTRPW